MDKDIGDAVDAELFAGGESADSDRDALLAQYRVFVETSEALISRRQGVNTFFSFRELGYPRRRWTTLARRAIRRSGVRSSGRAGSRRSRALRRVAPTDEIVRAVEQGKVRRDHGARAPPARSFVHRGMGRPWIRSESRKIQVLYRNGGRHAACLRRTPGSSGRGRRLHARSLRDSESHQEWTSTKANGFRRKRRRRDKVASGGRWSRRRRPTASCNKRVLSRASSQAASGLATAASLPSSCCRPKLSCGTRFRPDQSSTSALTTSVGKVSPSL